MADADTVSAEILAYGFTVEAIVCIDMVFKDLADARLRQGPRMRTADGTTVTPDMTLEAAEGQDGAGYRAVCEIKSSFPRHRASVDQMVKQVQHYDGELSGWEDEADPDGSRGDDHDIVIGVRDKHALDFASGLPAALKERGVEIKSPLSIIGIVRNKDDNDVDRFLLRKSFGKISRKKAHDALGRGWSIDSSSMARDLDNTKFYDSRPPLPYIMAVLWARVFPSLTHGKKLKRLRMGMEVTIDVEVGRIHRLASMLAHSSNPMCVKRAWIKDAMEEFARVGQAKKVGSDKYRIQYSMHESRPAEWFARVAATGVDRAEGSKVNQE